MRRRLAKKLAKLGRHPFDHKSVALNRWFHLIESSFMFYNTYYPWTFSLHRMKSQFAIRARTLFGLEPAAEVHYGISHIELADSDASAEMATSFAFRRIAEEMDDYENTRDEK